MPRSWAFTSNRAFSEWTGIFPNEACDTALIDRLIHHADIITIEEQSYRRSAAEESAAARKTKAKL